MATHRTIGTRSMLLESLLALKNQHRREMERRRFNNELAITRITHVEAGTEDVWQLPGKALQEGAGRSRGIGKQVEVTIPKKGPATKQPRAQRGKAQTTRKQRVRSTATVTPEQIAFNEGFKVFPEGSKLQRPTAVSAFGFVKHHGMDPASAVAKATAVTVDKVKAKKLADPMGLVK